jgi:hypothetical protein
MSLGGHRYSQLYIDRGSGYLWAVRMAKKSGHYTATPDVVADARAASGRRLQYFHTDGEGVFASGEISGRKKYDTSGVHLMTPTPIPLWSGLAELCLKVQLLL